MKSKIAEIPQIISNGCCTTSYTTRQLIDFILATLVYAAGFFLVSIWCLL